jgi:N-methylhydantoinase A/oxoprolinase/acetone carboxylase beta subunit
MQEPAVDDTAWKLGVDVGGTFTDAVLYNEITGKTYKAKVFLAAIRLDLLIVN